MIHMQVSSADIKYLVGSEAVLNEMTTAPVLRAFSDEAVEFLSALSREILQTANVREFVDVVSYAYWIRRASLESARKDHIGYQNRLGRGIAFHIAPSNIPVNFAVSMTSSLLAGNCTVIRISDKPFPQVDLLCNAINALLRDRFSNMKKYLCIIRYSHSAEITDMLSSVCDLRVIWGGNRSVSEIRKSPLPPRAIEMTFPDRYSLAVIDSEYYLSCDPARIAKDFYTDTYFSDQNACSSPRLIVWLGKNKEEAKQRFWNEISALAKQSYDLKPIQAVEKYMSVCMLGASGISAHRIQSDNYVVRVALDSLTTQFMDYRSRSGLFFEYDAEKLEEIVPVLTKTCQTVSVLGVAKQAVKDIVFRYGVRGVDRIVTMGQTMGIEFYWDGFKMIDTMSRIVYAYENE